ncbi:hypothetical protein As57867_007138, partial [Aphanomyces stellatus]
MLLLGDSGLFAAATVLPLLAVVTYAFFVVFSGLAVFGDPVVYTLYRRTMIQIHVVAVSLASVSLLLQLVPHLRKTYRRFHRLNGRFCITMLVMGLGLGILAL